MQWLESLKKMSCLNDINKIEKTPINATFEFIRLVRIVQPYYGQIKYQSV